MGSRPYGRYARDKTLLLIVYFGFYFTLFISMIADHRLLAQIRPAAFHYNRDLTELALIAIGLPKWMIAHPWSFGLADTLIFVLPLLLLLSAWRKGRFPAAGGIIFVLFLALYLLLANLFWQVHYEPFILYVLLPLAFITSREHRFEALLKGCRYYFLYIFVSAAGWKLFRGSLFNGEEMSRILLVHHGDWLSGNCTEWICRFYAWLIDHPAIAQSLYIASFALEGFFVIGFFTRRYDRLLLALAVLFVAADWVVMRIPYWSLLLGGFTLWLDTRPRKRTMVVYETTHHENLPALLDLCEAQFPRVIVFLKEVSFMNISGQGGPASRWPKTEFIVQAPGESNRRFIGRLFRAIRMQQYSHLHLSTLDNNLLVFATRLWLSPGLQVSLTVHEVNEYFTRRLDSPRDMTESLAKPLLHRRIGHYSFFLPAMAARFHEQMPGAVAVFIPSRFYTSPPPDRQQSNTKSFTIVIPGSVDGNRRDYEAVVALFRSWGSAGSESAATATSAGPSTATTFPGPVRLVILGDSTSPYGAGIVAQLRRLESENFTFRHFEGYVPETLYEREIEAADLLWSPLRIHKTGSRNNPETYGQTTASGLTADLLLNNAPALTPHDLVLPEPFQTALLPYRDINEANALLFRLITDADHREKLRRSIHQAFTFFVKENFTAAFAALTATPGEVCTSTTAAGKEGKEGRTDAIETIHPDIQ